MRRWGILLFLGACSSDSGSVEINAIAGTRQTIDGASGADVSLVDDAGNTVPIADATNTSGTLAFQVPLLSLTSTYHVRVGSQTEDNVILHPSALVSFDWNSATESEDYSIVDASTGERTKIGTAGDLRWWDAKGGATFSDADHRVYVVGSPDDTQATQKVYTLDATTGELLSSAVLTDRAPSGLLVNNGGTLLGFQTSEAEVDVISIDPTTGVLTTLDAVPGPFAGWQLENSIDLENERVYHIAFTGTLETPDPPFSVYSINSETGAFVGSAPIVIDGVPLTRDFGGVKYEKHLHRLIGFRWNGSAEEMLSVDPSSGSGTVIGTVGDLVSWQTHAVFNETTSQILVFGSDANDTPKMYVMDTHTGELAYDLQIAKLPSDALVVRGASVEE